MVAKYIPEISGATFFGHPGNKGDAIVWGLELGAAVRDMGVLDMASFDIEALMKADEDQADALDKAHAEMAGRVLEVDEVIDPADSRRWVVTGLLNAQPRERIAHKKRPNIDTW